MLDIYGRLNNSSPKMCTSWSPEHVTVTSHGKRDFADMTKLRILRWGDYLALSEWARCNHRVLIRGKQEDQSQQ